MNLKVVTYNLRCQFDGGDGINNFIHRAGCILLKIDKEKPDVICFQEITDPMRSFFAKFLTDYTVLGHGRNEDRRGEGVSIAYRRDCMELVSLEQFWLSDTPNVPASRFQNQSVCPRICPVAVLKHKNMTTPVAVYGIHLDHVSDEARVLGMELVIKKASYDREVMGDMPIFVLGDFNCYPDSPAIKLCTDKGLVDVADKLQVTFHNYGNYTNKDASTNQNGVKGVKIDYIFTDASTAKMASNLEIWDEIKDGIYLSDHYPISCEFCFPET